MYPERVWPKNSSSAGLCCTRQAFATPIPNDISQTNNITAAVYRVRRELKKSFMVNNLRPHPAAVRALAHSQRIA
jgi:hypothetical protein